MLRSDLSPVFTPEEIGQLITVPVQEASVAMRVSTVLATDRDAYTFPMVLSNPVAAWTAEGAEITESDALYTAEATVIPRKVAGLTVISNELAKDSSPAAASLIGEGLSRDIAKRVDTAFFGSTTTNGPDGLESIASMSDTWAAETAHVLADRIIADGKLYQCTTAGTTGATEPATWTTTTVTDGTVVWTFLMHVVANAVSAGTAWADMDPFNEAIYAAEGLGATLGVFCANPADALALAVLKESTGSNRDLLQPDPTQPSRRILAGVPLVVSSYVPEGVIWGIPRASVYTIMREDTALAIDKSRYFEKDSIGIRATMRVTFGFPNPGAIQRIALSTT